MAVKKFYAVKKGLVPGIYDTWDECKPTVNGYPGAVYKSFLTIEEAQDYLVNKEINVDENSENFAYVDGSFNLKTSTYGFGILAKLNGEEYELNGTGNDPDMLKMRNVSGEILGAMAAVSLAIEKNVKELTLYYDYAGIEMWATGEWKRNLPGTIQYSEFMRKASEKILVHFVHVKGHSGIEGNEKVDKLAKAAVGC